MCFHPLCLRCIRCSMSIMSGEKLYMHNDNPLCRVCIAAMKSQQCFACGGAISAQKNSRGLRALGKHFHVKCFLCSVSIEYPLINKILHPLFSLKINQILIPCRKINCDWFYGTKKMNWNQNNHIFRVSEMFIRISRPFKLFIHKFRTCL